MGFVTSTEYQAAAQQVVGRDGVERFERLNGDRLFYDYRTNEFVIVSADNRLVTYMLPNNGQDYWLDTARD
jgi:pyocin large subunit-like protein